MSISETDKLVLHRCLEVVVNRYLFEDGEFSTLFGVDRSAVAAILARWPDVNPDDSEVHVAVTNALNNLLGYPHGRDIKVLVGVTPSELASLLTRWQSWVP